MEQYMPHPKSLDAIDAEWLSNALSIKYPGTVKSKGDRPRFFVFYIFVNPERIEVSAVWPGESPQFQFHLSKKICG
jgi:hypothetical protein